MKTIEKQIILIFALLSVMVLSYLHHKAYNSQELYIMIKHPAIVNAKDWYYISIEDSTGMKYRFKRSDMLGNTLMNMYNVNDTIIDFTKK